MRTTTFVDLCVANVEVYGVCYVSFIYWDSAFSTSIGRMLVFTIGKESKLLCVTNCDSKLSDGDFQSPVGRTYMEKRSVTSLIPFSRVKILENSTDGNIFSIEKSVIVGVGLVNNLGVIR